MLSPFLKTIELDFATISLYEDYVISTIKEGVLFDSEEQKIIYSIFNTYYPYRSFGYISNRKFDYTVNPSIYLKSTDFEHLVGMTVVCYSESSFKIATFEKAFFNGPFNVFYKVGDCEKWILNQISHYKEKAGL